VEEGSEQSERRKTAGFQGNLAAPQQDSLVSGFVNHSHVFASQKRARWGREHLGDIVFKEQGELKTRSTLVVLLLASATKDLVTCDQNGPRNKVVFTRANLET